MALVAKEEVLAQSVDAPISMTPDSVRVFLAAGEEVLAYETLCQNLYEIDARLPVGLAEQLRRAAVAAGADPALADLLRP